MSNLISRISVFELCESFRIAWKSTFIALNYLINVLTTLTPDILTLILYIYIHIYIYTTTRESSYYKQWVYIYIYIDIYVCKYWLKDWLNGTQK